MELNLITLLYLFFRLAPFVIVSFFALSSLFNQDIKGVIYLVGLLLACFFTVLIGNSLNASSTQGDTPDQVCNLITVGSSGSFSNIPLGISMLSYTFIYLVYVIAKNHLEMYNLPTLILFPLLILADLIWNIKNGCYKPYGIILSIIIGGGVGAAWAAIIDSIKKPDLFFLNTGSNRTACSRPSAQLFKCTFKNPKNASKSNK
jgi:hypothetical protein